MVVLVATSHQGIKSSFLFGRLEASSAMAPTSTELVLSWPSLTTLPATSGLSLDSSAKLQLDPSLLCSWDLKTNRCLRAGSIKGKNSAKNLVTHLPAVTWGFVQTRLRLRQGMVQQPHRCVVMARLHGHGQVPSPCLMVLPSVAAQAVSKLQEGLLTGRDSLAITQGDSAGGWVRAPGRAAEQTDLPQQRCDSLALWANLVCGTKCRWIFPISLQTSIKEGAFLQIRLTFWCLLQRAGHLRCNKTTYLVCKQSSSSGLLWWSYRKHRCMWTWANAGTRGGGSVTMAGGAGLCVHAGGATMGNMHYRCFLSSAAAQAELDFWRRKQSPGVGFLCMRRVCHGARVSGTAEVRGSHRGCSGRRKSAFQGWRQGKRCFFLERRGGSWRREPSLRKGHGRKRLRKCAADVDTEERDEKGACSYSLSLQRGE